MAEADLSKIVNIIMENPQLVEQIRDMISKAEDNPPSSTEEAKGQAEEPAVSDLRTENAYPKHHSSRRNDLLRAIRPYVSEERSRAIESMITIADVLFALREK